MGMTLKRIVAAAAALAVFITSAVFNLPKEAILAAANASGDFGDGLT